MFLEKQVKPNARVLVIGPGVLHADPSTFQLNKIVHQKGQLVVLDLPDKLTELIATKKAYASRTANRLPGKHMGSMSSYGTLQNFRYSWPYRIELPHLVGGVAGQMPLKSKKFDVVYDHSALPFAAYMHPETQVLSEYFRVLKPGGKIILTAPQTMKPEYESVINKVPGAKTTRVLVHERQKPGARRKIPPTWNAEIAWILRKRKQNASKD